MKQTRLEALKLAVGFTKTQASAIKVATAFTQFIETGPPVRKKRVPREEKPATVEPESEPIRPRRQRRAALS